MTTTHAAGAGAGHTAAAVADAALSDVAACACHLYDAECALHAAHRSGVEHWITAASDKLHQAVVAYLAAAAAARPHQQPHAVVRAATATFARPGGLTGAA
jgi:hypothetical protein